MEWNRDKERRAGKAMSIGGCVYGIVFVVIWCVIAAAMGAGIMLIFGIPMLGLLVFRLVVLIQKSKEKPRDPWERPMDQTKVTYTAEPRSTENSFCPYCGEKVKGEFVFCPKCGRRLS